MVAMVNLSGTAGPISIKCGRAGAELRRLMPTQTDGKERLLRHAGWRRGEERRGECRVMNENDQTIGRLNRGRIEGNVRGQKVRHQLSENTPANQMNRFEPNCVKKED